VVTMSPKIGVLALQGDFAKHVAMLTRMQVAASLVKKPGELAACDGLIIPGGESTTLTKLLQTYNFYAPIREFARTRPVLGTCAGMILVAAEVPDARVTPLNLLDIAVQRNAYGRQIDSFITDVPAPFLEPSHPFPAVFIRAPQVTRIGKEIETLMTWQGKPVMVRCQHIFALAFHPELTDDPRIHQYFVQHC